MNLKKCLADSITFKLENVDFENLIVESISPDKGDYCLPCFSLAKLMKKSPVEIANIISASIEKTDLIERVEILNGYINFFLNKTYVSKMILENFNLADLKLNDGKNEIVLIDYGSPNLAKFLHIGHLKSSIIGESLARLFEQCGYVVKRLNYVGDYGTPFGKIIGGMLKWGSMEEVKQKGNEVLQDYYIRFNQEEKDNPELTQFARDIFKKIELRDKEIYPIYQTIVDIALADAKRMFDLLGVKFDDYRGEMYYNQFAPQVIKMLEDKHLLVESQGAKIVDLSPYDLTPAVILKNDGTTLYTTRDICAVIERYKEYHFNKMIYVTAIQQNLNFQQLFKIMELAGYEFAHDMEHVSYGMMSLPDGKISSRRGKQAVLVDLMDYALNEANNIIKDRKFEIEDPKEVAKKVARAVLNFSVLKVDRNKDCVFDVKTAFSFEGETAPYMQYTYTRIESILRKHEESKIKANYTCFNLDAFELVKYINDFALVIRQSLIKRDPSIMVKRLLDICKTFNKFYTATKILDGDDDIRNAKINLIKALRDVLALGFNLICIDTLKEM